MSAQATSDDDRAVKDVELLSKLDRISDEEFNEVWRRLRRTLGVQNNEPTELYVRKGLIQALLPHIYLENARGHAAVSLLMLMANRTGDVSYALRAVADASPEAHQRVYEALLRVPLGEADAFAEPNIFDDQVFHIVFLQTLGWIGSLSIVKPERYATFLAHGMLTLAALLPRILDPNPGALRSMSFHHYRQTLERVCGDGHMPRDDALLDSLTPLQINVFAHLWAKDARHTFMKTIYMMRGAGEIVGWLTRWLTGRATKLNEASVELLLDMVGSSFQLHFGVQRPSFAPYYYLLPIYELLLETAMPRRDYVDNGIWRWETLLWYATLTKETASSYFTGARKHTQQHTPHLRVVALRTLARYINATTRPDSELLERCLECDLFGRLPSLLVVGEREVAAAAAEALRDILPRLLSNGVTMRLDRLLRLVNAGLGRSATETMHVERAVAFLELAHVIATRVPYYQFNYAVVLQLLRPPQPPPFTAAAAAASADGSAPALTTGTPENEREIVSDPRVVAAAWRLLQTRREASHLRGRQWRLEEHVIWPRVVDDVVKSVLFLRVRSGQGAEVVGWASLPLEVLLIVLGHTARGSCA